MTWYPIAFLPPQYENASGDPYSGAVLKAYSAGTTSNIPLATSYTGATTAASLALNSLGFPVYGGNVVIPHVQENYKLVLYPTQAAADLNSGAVWTVDNIRIADDTNNAFVQYFSGDNTTTNFTLSEDLGSDEKVLMVFADRKIPNYLLNGDFATDTVWTKGAGWTITGGAAVATGAISTNIFQTSQVPLIKNQAYTVRYTVTRSAGSVTPSIGSTSGTARAASGTYSELIIADGVNSTVVFSGSGFTGTVDDVTFTPATDDRRQILRPLDEYVLSGTTLSLTEAPPAGTNNIIVFAPSLLLGAAASSAAAAATSETNASNSATAAAASASSASASATAAAASATAASASATAAAGYAALLQFPAIGSDKANWWGFAGGDTVSSKSTIQVNATGGAGRINMLYNTKGTTTANGGQYNDLLGGVAGLTNSGRHRFQVNGSSAFEITDTYWNPNITNPGQPNGWVVASSGWGDSTSTSDAIAGALSVESSIYPGGNCSGLTMIAGAKGESGMWHFLMNGALGHVTIDFPLNSNPTAPDVYSAYVNGIRFAGAFGTTGVSPQIKINPSGHANDANIGLTVYNFAKGGVDFISQNGVTGLFKIKHKDNGVNQLNVEPGATGVSPIMYAGGGAGNVRTIIAGSDTAGVDLCNGGQYNGTAACAKLAAFSGAFEPPSYFDFTAAATCVLNTTAGAIQITGQAGAANIILGAAALATTATAGFPWMPSGAGAPTGAATAPYTGAVAYYYDSTNNFLYIRSGGTWRKSTVYA